MRRSVLTALVILTFVAVATCCAMVTRPDPRVPLGPSRTFDAQKLTAVHVYKTCIDLVQLKVKFWRGSGVLTSRNEVITAKHVVNANGFTCIGPRLRVKTSDGVSFAVKEKREHETLDVAWLTLSAPAKFHVPPVGRSWVKKDDVVCLTARAPTVEQSCGHVIKVDGRNFRHDTWVRAGNSGSGVYDVSGRLVGIVSTGYRFAGSEIPSGGGWAVAVWGLD